MPSYTRGKPRDQIRAVLLGGNSYYQFKTKDLAAVNSVQESDLALLGHIKLGEGGETLPAGAIVFLRANSPKPARVTKTLTGTQGSIGTFCAAQALQNALRNGWNLSKGATTVSLRATGSRTVTAIASLSNGALYAFALNKADFESYGADLKLQGAESITSDTERSKLVSGSSLPRPGKAKLVLTTGSIFSSYCSHDAPLSNGFTRMSAERVL
ncbi:conserved hypothetical protein [Microcystis aeruginosa PCC 9807]|uniref:Uncharacterized protein n=1 Tax=Microcystis aeruginosa PCC 9807 TaxID=1160283 RepID=I4H903_MICAE|nr:hypothetical protein [Microcystis aeruginosa]CCI18527.1 conserved hypothetical protein [Microcystis aeruginosa PCC 9807]